LRVKWLEQPEATQDSTKHIFAPSRRLYRVALASVELILILAQIGLVLASHMKTPHNDYVIFSALASWNYILILNLLRVISFSRDKSIFGILWLHTALLYALQWIPTLWIARSVIIHSTRTLTQVFGVTSCALATLLVVSAGLTPAYQTNSVPAKDRGALETSPEAQASVFGLATFQWVDQMVLKGYKKTLELRDVWALSEGDEAVNILNGFRNLRCDTSN
jgi:hypothetical protein